MEQREEPRAKPRPEVRVETVTQNKNLIKNHPVDKIIGREDKGVMTRNKVHEELCLISQVEPKSADEACKDDHWNQVMKEELDQVLRETCELVLRPKGKSVIGTKWVFQK